MCIISYKPKDTKLNLGNIKEGFASNSDGTGIMYPHKGKLIIDKGYFEWPEFSEVLQKLDKDIGIEKMPLVIHSRIATSGDLDKATCHPFRTHKNTGLVHNGVITGYDKDATTSDTGHFVKDFVSKLPKTYHRHKYHQKLLAKEIGDYNKLVIMNGGGNVMIVNEEAGTWDGGVWYSNHSYVCYNSPMEPMGGAYDAPNLWTGNAEDFETARMQGMYYLGLSQDGNTGEVTGVCSTCDKSLPFAEVLVDEGVVWCENCWQIENYDYDYYKTGAY